jgi:hypothetical protein
MQKSTTRERHLLPLYAAPDGAKPGYFTGHPVAQTSKSAVSQVSKPANVPLVRHPADLEIGDTAGWETCATP